MGTERYRMCEDQPAQIDCRVEECVFYKQGGCTNSSPALTLTVSGYLCWSRIPRSRYLEVKSKELQDEFYELKSEIEKLTAEIRRKL